ncbi:hypothetical protein [Ekhidna sp.]|uniref:hypothetical protein n=1 Tax=Ekhidna sp. TaxID=2608089 RepID=UPI003297641A
MKIRLLSKLVILLALLFKLSAQEAIQYSEINVVPPSPNVASLNKFIDVPVSHYTGIPSINIPIYTVDLPQLQLPISMNYHAGGLRVEEHASWIGAGWSLSAGGSVSRTLRGIPDESDSFAKWGWFTDHTERMFNSSGGVLADSIFSCYSQYSELGSTWGGAAVIRADTLAKGWIDSEPDVYHYSLPSGGGKFIFTRDRAIYKLDTDNFSINNHPFQSSTLPNYPNESDYSWVIFGPDGIKYTFDTPERTTVTSDCGSADSPYDGPGGLDYYQSAWLLTKMSLNGDSIVFDYEVENLTYDQRLSSTQNEKIPGGSGNPPSGSHCYNTTSVTSYRLSKITASNGVTVDFLAQESGSRTDLNGSKRLTRINIKRGSQYIKGFLIDTDSYFGSNSKLKLNSVTPINENGNIENGYSFDYYSEGTVPASDSRGQDYWGFYNGSSATGSLIPEFKDNTFHFNPNGVNRDPSLTNTRTGTLHKINFPTGGYTQFDYELNSRYDSSKRTTYRQSIEADGTNGAGDEKYSPIFIVGQNCSATLEDNVVQNGESIYAYLEDSLGNIINLNQVVEGNRLILPSGTYRLHAYDEEDNETAQISIEYEQVEPGIEEIGGLRIKKISNSAGIEKTYSYTGNDGNPSGILFSPPSFTGVVHTNYPGSMPGLICEDNDGDYPPVSWLTLSDKSQLPGITYQGSHIGYSMVREIARDPFSSARNGMTVYEFINDNPPLNNDYPFVPSTDLSYKNGKIKEKSIYKTYVYQKDTTILGLPTTTDSIANTKIKSIQYSYNEYTLNSQSIRAFKVGKVATRFCYRCSTTINDDFKLNLYDYQRKWYALSSVEETSFETSGQLSTTLTYHYGDSLDHTFPTAQTQSFGSYSHKDLMVRHSSYPALVSTYSKSLLKPGVSARQLSGTKLTYHGKLPLTVKKWDSEDDSYNLEAEYTYDGNRVITKKIFSGNSSSAGLEIEENYLWAFDNSSVVAVITNATRAEIDQKLTTTDFTNLQNGVNIESIVGGLRSNLSDAQVRTFLWRYGYGIEKEIDPNGYAKSYSYDPFGRLIEVRDDDDNIVARYQYQYISQ